jgi:hypothetical protein
MGFYIRRSIKLGPLRFNFSKGGVGISTGVKGARIGVTPKGRRYFHGGRYGVYYRQWLDKPSSAPISLPGIYTQSDRRPNPGVECSCTHDSSLHIWSESFHDMTCTRCGCSHYHTPFHMRNALYVLLLIGLAIGIALILIKS